MLWSPSKKKWFWYGVPTALVVSLIIITLQVHNNEEAHINEAMLENQIEIQQTVTEAIANNIRSEIQLILAEMNILANSDELQKDLGTAESSEIIQQSFRKMNLVAPTVQVLAIDETGEIVSQVSKHHAKLVGKNLKWAPFFLKDAVRSGESQVGIIHGNIFKSPEILIVHPISDKENGERKGFLVVTLPSERFFSRHGNIYDLDSQFIVVLDKNEIYIAGPTENLIGENVFEEKTLTHFDYNEDLISHYRKVFEGKPLYSLYDYGLGERLNTSHPVTIDGENEFYLSVITPTSTIYGEVNELVFEDKVQTTLLIIGIVAILGIFLFKRTQAFEQEKLATIGQLSSNIAHDMRNPLGAIKSSSRRIQNQNKTEKNQVISDEVLRINRAVKRMSHQIEGVLNYVRSTPLIPSDISVREMLDYSLDVVNVPENIKLMLPDNDVTIECDSEKIENVFVNLVLNAVQAMDAQKTGEIKVRLEEQKTHIKLEFENSGPSIPEDKISEIFKPLYTTKLKGTGLGLSGCKNIVEQHKGKISVISNPVVFTVVLPKKVDEAG